MSRMRSISKAYEEIKKNDPDTCISKYFLNQLVLNKEIPCKRSGVKKLIDMDMLEDYLKQP